MKKAALLLAAGTLLLTPQSGLAVADDARTLSGRYVWDHRDNTGDLEAVFTPTGAGKWDVVFHFTFRGKPRVYEGTAEGSLTEGALQGTVRNESKERTFTFSGKFADGKFSGEHAEVEDGEARTTGTLTLGG